MEPYASAPLSARLERKEHGSVLRVVVPVRVSPKAVVRNRIRRRIRAALESIRVVVPEHHRLILVVRDPNLPPPVRLKEFLMMLMLKSGIVDR